MRILAIDTSTRFLCAAIYDKGKIYEYTLELGQRLSDSIMPTLERICKAARMSLSDFDYFACGQGPGSFTGLRIGISTIKGLALALNKPVVAVPTLDAIALNLPPAYNYAAVLIDARRNLFYHALYKLSGKEYKRISKYQLLDQEEIIKTLKPQAVCTGDGLDILSTKIMSAASTCSVADKDYWYPRPYNILKIALAKINSSDLTDAFKIKPMYLYPKECQIKRNP